jgi:Na+-driven multidrug efflux pump
MSVLNSFLSSTALGIVLSFGIIHFSPQLIKYFGPTSDAENAECQEEKSVNSEGIHVHIYIYIYIYIYLYINTLIYFRITHQPTNFA